MKLTCFSVTLLFILESLSSFGTPTLAKVGMFTHFPSCAERCGLGVASYFLSQRLARFASLAHLPKTPTVVETLQNAVFDGPHTERCAAVGADVRYAV